MFLEVDRDGLDPRELLFRGRDALRELLGERWRPSSSGSATAWTGGQELAQLVRLDLTVELGDLRLERRDELAVVTLGRDAAHELLERLAFLVVSGRCVLGSVEGVGGVAERGRRVLGCLARFGPLVRGVRRERACTSERAFARRAPFEKRRSGSSPAFFAASSASVHAFAASAWTGLVLPVGARLSVSSASFSSVSAATTCCGGGAPCARASRAAPSRPRSPDAPRRRRSHRAPWRRPSPRARRPRTREARGARPRRPRARPCGAPEIPPTTSAASSECWNECARPSSCPCRGASGPRRRACGRARAARGPSRRRGRRGRRRRRR